VERETAEVYFTRKDQALKAEESAHNMKLSDKTLKVSFVEEIVKPAEKKVLKEKAWQKTGGMMIDEEDYSEKKEVVVGRQDQTDVLDRIKKAK
jgi:hypothetical protein